jgi:molybdopterin-guanine dinucleotide biosynthesis protein A
MGEASADDLTAFILAGGKSTRMGRDKALVDWKGRSLLARALELARCVTTSVYIVGSGKKFAEFGPVLEDKFQDSGPLGGIHAALLVSQTDLNVMLAVDTPFVTAKFLHYLIAQARSAPEAVVIVPSTGGRSQPLCALYRREFAGVAEEALRSGRNKIDLLFDRVPIRSIEEKELEGEGFSQTIFRNLNTPEQMEAEMRRP